MRARSLGLSDLAAYQRARDLLETLKADVAHGHGAKGGAYARLAVRTLRARGADVETSIRRMAAAYTSRQGRCRPASSCSSSANSWL